MATSKSKPAAKAPKGRMIHMCCDRILVGMQKIQAMQAAIKENPLNGPPPPPKNKPFGASSLGAPMKLALMTGKKWKDGRTIGVAFMDGSATQKTRVIAQAKKWEPYANIHFDFTASKAAAEIRISFVADSGSWSYIGTDCLTIAKNEPTMNFGWLRDDTDDVEFERVVVHEFGHALGAIHEHQNPKGGIAWNEAAVYAFFAGPPNNWTKDETFTNVIMKYSVDQLNASNYDKDSIMLYQFDGALIKGGQPTPFNTRLSKGDKRFIRKQYP
jgi:Astacin (Peptidase family M12A)